jgi:hypothetical protein
VFRKQDHEREQYAWVHGLVAPAGQRIRTASQSNRTGLYGFIRGRDLFVTGLLQALQIQRRRPSGQISLPLGSNTSQWSSGTTAAHKGGLWMVSPGRTMTSRPYRDHIDFREGERLGSRCGWSQGDNCCSWRGDAVPISASDRPRAVTLLRPQKATRVAFHRDSSGGNS